MKNVLSAVNHLEDTYSPSKLSWLTRVLMAAECSRFLVLMKKSVVGCATVASQAADTSGIRNLSLRQLLLLNGTGNRRSPSYSESLYAAYGMRVDRKIQFSNSDDQSLRRNSVLAEQLLCNSITGCAGVVVDGREEANVLSKSLIFNKDRTRAMEKGRNLRGNETAE